MILAGRGEHCSSWLLKMCNSNFSGKRVAFAVIQDSRPMARNLSSLMTLVMPVTSKKDINNYYLPSKFWLVEDIILYLFINKWLEKEFISRILDVVSNSVQMVQAMQFFHLVLKTWHNRSKVGSLTTRGLHSAWHGHSVQSQLQLWRSQVFRGGPAWDT